MTLGRIIVDLLARTGSFDTDLNRSAKLAQKRAKEIDAAFRRAGTAIGTALGLSVAGAVTAVVAGVKSAIDNMDQLRDASIRLGIGVETLSALRYAAQQTGTDFETLGKGLKIFAKNAADALNPKSGKAQIFEALGIQVTDASGKLKDLGVLLPEVADKYKQLADGTAKAALSQELFGKAGLELTEFLNQGSDGLKTLMDRAKELGVVIDQDAADKADKFKDKLNDLESALGGVAMQVAGGMLDDLSDLTDWAVKFVSDGGNSAKIAHEIADGFRDMIEIGKGFGQLIEFLEGVRTKINDIQQSMIDGNWLTIARKNFQQQLGLNEDWSKQGPPMRSGPIPKTPLDNAFSIPGVRQPFSAVPTGQDYSNYTSKSINTKALQNALAGVGGGGGSKKKTGKSDEEREAERLQQAYEQQNATLQEQIALFGKDGEAAKLRYAMEFGELSNLDPLKKDELLQRAETLDLMRAEQEQMEKTAEADKKAAEEKLRGIESTDQFIQSMEEELKLLGLRGKELERAIALRYADANATDEQRAAIARLSDEIYNSRKVAQGWDEVQRDLADTFENVAKDAANAEDYIKGFFDSIADYIRRSISENWAEQIVKIFSGMGSGSNSSSVMDPTTGNMVSSGGGGSGFWATAASWIGALFGARDWGGPVMEGGSYLVGERGPEMFIPRTAGTIVPAQQTAAKAGGGFHQTNNFQFASPVDPRTQTQLAAKVGFESQRATSRNR